jgi:hypothetical protein
MVMNRDALVRNPQETFKEPNRVVESQDLSDAQKIEVLENWRLDLLELLVATEENMEGISAPGEVADKLRRVCEVLDALRHSEPASDA